MTIKNKYIRYKKTRLNMENKNTTNAAITSKENLSKQRNCSQTIDELLGKILEK